MSSVAVDPSSAQADLARVIAPIVGTLCHVSLDGVPFVDFPGNLRGPLRAGVAAHIDRSHVAPGSPVIIVFEGNDPERPVILAPVADRLADSVRMEALPERPQDVLVDGERVVLDAAREIVLRCGKASITLRSDGKIVIRGTELVSRSSGVNKIKGAAVNIN